jgi:hypothetical protein
VYEREPEASLSRDHSNMYHAVAPPETLPSARLFGRHHAATCVEYQDCQLLGGVLLLTYPLVATIEAAKRAYFSHLFADKAQKDCIYRHFFVARAKRFRVEFVSRRSRGSTGPWLGRPGWANGSVKHPFFQEE